MWTWSAAASLVSLQLGCVPSAQCISCHGLPGSAHDVTVAFVLLLEPCLQTCTAVGRGHDTLSPKSECTKCRPDQCHECMQELGLPFMQTLSGAASQAAQAAGSGSDGASGQHLHRHATCRHLYSLLPPPGRHVTMLVACRPMLCMPTHANMPIAMTGSCCTKRVRMHRGLELQGFQALQEMDDWAESHGDLPPVQPQEASPAGGLFTAQLRWLIMPAHCAP